MNAVKENTDPRRLDPSGLSAFFGAVRKPPDTLLRGQEIWLGHPGAWTQMRESWGRLEAAVREADPRGIEGENRCCGNSCTWHSRTCPNPSYPSTKGGSLSIKRDRLAVAVFWLCIFTLLYLAYHIIRFYVLPHEQPKRDPTSTFGALAASVPGIVIEPTTTTVPPTTTTTKAPPRTTTTRANRGSRRTREIGDDFWKRLGYCESELGRTSRNIFQFSPDTAAKVGIDGSESYETQKAAAKAWAARIHPREGTNSGWPNCWWVALAG